jgi:hypothetical protein
MINQRSSSMNLPPIAPELAARLANYMIDDRARVVLRELAPLLDPHIGTAGRRPARPGGGDL